MLFFMELGRYVTLIEEPWVITSHEERLPDRPYDALFMRSGMAFS
jgi:hypothetical protein